MIANHGQYIHYHPDVIGVNSRLDTLQAAFLRSKLPCLDKYNAKKFKQLHNMAGRLMLYMN
jgi:dTDP-4-amino-4,6-dideoxygalactose transaminase